MSKIKALYEDTLETMETKYGYGYTSDYKDEALVRILESYEAESLSRVTELGWSSED